MDGVFKIRDGITDPVQGVVKEGALFRVVGDWKATAGQSWLECEGSLECCRYAMRMGYNDLPIDDEVVYGYINDELHLVHKSELVPLQ